MILVIWHDALQIDSMGSSNSYKCSMWCDLYWDSEIGSVVLSESDAILSFYLFKFPYFAFSLLLPLSNPCQLFRSHRMSAVVQRMVETAGQVVGGTMQEDEMMISCPVTAVMKWL